jgi:hypothetical protein
MKRTPTNKLLGLLRSRKFWAALVGMAFVILQEFIPDFPLDQEQTTNIVYVLVAYIIGTALDDAGQGIGGQPAF